MNREPGLAEAGVREQVQAGTSLVDRSELGGPGQKTQAAPAPAPDAPQDTALRLADGAERVPVTTLAPVLSPVAPDLSAVPSPAAELPAALAIGSFPAQSATGAASSTGRSGISEGRASRSTIQPGRDSSAAASGLLHDLALKPGAKPEGGLDSDGQRPGGSERGSSGDAGPAGVHAHPAANDLQAAASPASTSAPAVTLPVAGNSTIFASGSEITGSDRHGAGSPSREGLGSGTVADAGDADRPAAASINTARVLQSMQGSEMRVGMHSVEFGSVSINTSVTHGAVAAQISYEHAELGRALAAHLPAMEARLSRDSGMEARVEVRQGSTTSGNMDTPGGQGRADSHRQGQSGSNHTHALPGSLGAGSAEMRPGADDRYVANAGTGRLDIRI